VSLAIDIDKVSALLLADGWHEVVDDSFYIDAYEYISKDMPDSSQFSGGPGFGIKENHGRGGSMMYGPVSAIIAVRTKA
jgi:hypothetical protein